MGTLENPTRIAGIKPKIRPTNKGNLLFDKKAPLGPHNYPLTQYTHWTARGFRKDAAGIKRPYTINQTLPTGSPFIPDLDEVIDVNSSFEGLVAPREEKRPEYQNIPYLFNKKVKYKTKDL
jgi:hypothetical protein